MTYEEKIQAVIRNLDSGGADTYEEWAKNILRSIGITEESCKEVCEYCGKTECRCWEFCEDCGRLKKSDCECL
jgi:hypothetical protein